MHEIKKALITCMADADVEDLKQLHKLVGSSITYSTLANRYRNPESFRIYELKAIAGALGVTVTDLLGGTK